MTIDRGPNGIEREALEERLLRRDDLATLDVQLVPHAQPRRRAGWPAELNAAVSTALANEQRRPPDGVSRADWDRVLAARRADLTQPVENLRHLGPALESDQALLTVDEVLTRGPERHRFCELPTARIVTAEGYRYLSGVGATFLQHLLVVVLLALGTQRSLLLIADGARLRPHLLYRHVGPHRQQDQVSRLVSPASEV